jgi:hypothetical protein
MLNQLSTNVSKINPVNAQIVTIMHVLQLILRSDTFKQELSVPEGENSFCVHEKFFHEPLIKMGKFSHFVFCFPRFCFGTQNDWKGISLEMGLVVSL